MALSGANIAMQPAESFHVNVCTYGMSV